MTQTEIALWVFALVLGAVVILVAVALLHELTRQVQRIQRGAHGVWATGKQVAANTASTWMLEETSRRLELLGQEALRHEEVLGGSAGPGGPARPGGSSRVTEV
jgi:hypothetical protein